MTTTEEPRPDADVRPEQRRATTALALLAVAQLMLVLDATVVNVALPDIGSDLRLTSGTVPWVMTSYTVVFGGLMLLGGRLADLLGSRRTTIAGLALFTASSLACALSQGAGLLLAGRVSQGIAAAVMSPAALSTALALFDEDGRAKALGLWSGLAGIGSVLGVILGGVLTGTAGWRWIFAINLPIGVALLVALPAVVPASEIVRTGRNTLDLPGAALVTAGTAAGIFGLTRAGTHGWGAWSTVVPLVGAAVLWAAFALVERRTARPLLRPDLLARRPVLAGASLMLVATGLLIGSFFVGSFVLQHARGYSAVRVGLYFLPVAVAVGLGAHLAGRLMALTNAKVVAAAGLGLAAAGYGAAAAWTAPVVLVAGLAVGALGIGATFVTAFTAALTDVGDQERGLRSALVNTFHELGGAAGVAVLSSVIGTALVAPGVTPADFTGALAAASLVAAAGVALALVVVPAVRPAPGAPPVGH